MLGGFRRLLRDEFELDDARYAQLGTEVSRWRDRALELGHRLEQRRERGPNLGYEL